MTQTQKTLVLCLMGILAPTLAFPAKAQERPGFSMPGSFPLYSAPPFQFRDNRILVITFRTAGEIARKLVPAPLIPNPAGLAFAYIGDLGFENPPFGSFRYLESGIGIPAVSPADKTLGNYVVVLYLDKALPIVPGREIWGWPKKDAAMIFAEKGGEVIGRVERYGTVLLEVKAKIRKKLDPSQGPPVMPWFLQKIIPSAVRNAPPDVRQLISQMNLNNVTNELWDCDADLELASGPQDPLAGIKVLEIVSARFSVGDFVMDYGKVLFDYLKKE